MSNAATDYRQARGLALVQGKGKRIKHIAGAKYLVPSATENAGGYVVDTEAATCSCPDHETRAVRCKHLWAVAYFRKEVAMPDGTTVVTESIRVTYSQDWPAYNRAQCEEKERVQVLLRGLCDGIVSPPAGRGRPRTPLRDAVYCATMKVYTTFSGRRATTDLEACASAGHMASAPHYNSISNYLDKPEMTPLLTALVEESASPMTSIETRFAVDSTGFSTCTYRRWYDAKYGREMKQAGWVKAHAMVGCTTNVITAVRVTDSDAHDGPELPALVQSTAASGFDMRDVTADKAYLSHANLAAIEAVGAVPYVPFKSNSKGDGPAAWRRMFGLFMYRHDEFLSHYHQRSLSESAFSAIKRKFGPAVRSKCFVAQTNEVLCKALCYNLAALCHAMHGLGVEPEFPGLRSLTVPS
jgi:transposase